MSEGPLTFSLNRKFLRTTPQVSCATLIPRALLSKAEFVVVQESESVRGVLPLRDLLVRPDARVGDLCGNSHALVFAPSISLAEISSAFASSSENAAAVVDLQSRVTGVLTCQDVIQLMMAKAKLLERDESRLQSDNHAKYSFIANLGHEARSSMTSILGYAALLRDHWADSSQLHDVKIIERNGQFLLAIINDVLDFAKIESGRLEIKKQPIEVDRLVNEVVSQIKAAIAGREIEVSAEYLTPLPETLSTDAARLRQILINLVSYWFNIPEAGSVTIRVQFPSEAAPQSLCIDVVHSGIGSAIELCESLFEPFTEPHSSSDPNPVGTGLGVPLSRRLAELLGGRIEVASQPDIGSFFRLLLPTMCPAGVKLSRARETTDEVRFSAAASLDQTLAGVRILVVDDRKDIRSLVQRILEKSGGVVSAVGDGKHVIDLLSPPATNEFDVILLDMQMPILSGFETLHELQKFRCQIPVIALTASALDEDREKCLSAGCRQYLSKPLAADELVQAIHQVIIERNSTAVGLSP